MPTIDLTDDGSWRKGSMKVHPRRRRFRVILAVAALALAGCNANQAINPCGQADPDCSPYDPISYAQNNTGNRGGGH